MPRAVRYLYIAALVLFALGVALLIRAKAESSRYDELQVVWRGPTQSMAPRFRILAFPAGVEGRGVPDRAILLSLDEWNDPVGVVQWWRTDTEETSVQRRLLRIDLTPDQAAPFVNGLNAAIAQWSDTDYRHAEYGPGESATQRRLTLRGVDGLQTAFEYSVTDTGEVTPIRILASGDKGAIISAGLYALPGVLLAFFAVLCVIIGAILHNNARRRRN